MEPRYFKNQNCVGETKKLFSLLFMNEGPVLFLAESSTVQVKRLLFYFFCCINLCCVIITQNIAALNLAKSLDRVNLSPARRQSGSCPVLARRLSGAKTDCRWNGDVLGGKMFNPSRARFSVFSDYKMAARWLTILYCLKEKSFYRRRRC